MGVEPPPKYVNRELNYQIGIRSEDSHFSETDGAPPTSMLLWGAAYYVKYVKHDANDSVCTHVLAAVRQCCNSLYEQDRVKHHTASSDKKNMQPSTIR